MEGFMIIDAINKVLFIILPGVALMPFIICKRYPVRKLGRLTKPRPVSLYIAYHGVNDKENKKQNFGGCKEQGPKPKPKMTRQNFN
jgi:hypothetical protein